MLYHTIPSLFITHTCCHWCGRVTKWLRAQSDYPILKSNGNDATIPCYTILFLLSQILSSAVTGVVESPNGCELSQITPSLNPMVMMLPRAATIITSICPLSLTSYPPLINITQIKTLPRAATIMTSTCPL